MVALCQSLSLVHQQPGLCVNIETLATILQRTATCPLAICLTTGGQSSRIARAVLVRDGREIYTSGSGSARFTDRPGRGFHWYYWRIELEGEAPDYPGNMKVAEGNLAWSSPHRVHVR